MTEALKAALNDICTYLQEGAIWHRRAANQMRMHSIRGWGRWEECEAAGDAAALCCLEKLLVDHLEFVPEITTDNIVRALKYVMGSQNEFKSHHKTWIDREEKLIEALNVAIGEMRAVDICIYEKLCCILREVQNEVMRVRLAHGRLELANWNGHDIGVCSKWIHQYFEKEYDGGEIDFNIG